jgi:hypothetical protein
MDGGTKLVLVDKLGECGMKGGRREADYDTVSIGNTALVFVHTPINKFRKTFIKKFRS